MPLNSRQWFAALARSESDREAHARIWRSRGCEQAGWQTVVGVVGDVRYREVEAARFDLYLPYRQSPNQVQHFMIRLSGDPRAAVPALRTAVAALDPDARLDDPLTFSSATLVLITVCVLAAYLPARSAARIDPAVALRAD